LGINSNSVRAVAESGSGIPRISVPVSLLGFRVGGLFERVLGDSLLSKKEDEIEMLRNWQEDSPLPSFCPTVRRRS
jgi:hypothetical protein